MKKMLSLMWAALVALWSALVRLAVLGRSALVVVVPVMTLTCIWAGIEYGRPALLVVGGLLWLDFWANRVATFIVRLKTLRLVRQASEPGASD